MEIQQQGRLSFEEAMTREKKKPSGLSGNLKKGFTAGQILHYHVRLLSVFQNNLFAPTLQKIIAGLLQTTFVVKTKEFSFF